MAGAHTRAGPDANEGGKRTRELAATSGHDLTEVALKVGFGDQAHFSRSFNRQFGLTPTEYRKSRLGSP